MGRPIPTVRKLLRRPSLLLDDEYNRPYSPGVDDTIIRHRDDLMDTIGAVERRSLSMFGFNATMGVDDTECLVEEYRDNQDRVVVVVHAEADPPDDFVADPPIVEGMVTMHKILAMPRRPHPIFPGTTLCWETMASRHEVAVRRLFSTSEYVFSQLENLTTVVAVGMNQTVVGVAAFRRDTPLFADLVVIKQENISEFLLTLVTDLEAAGAQINSVPCVDAPLSYTDLLVTEFGWTKTNYQSDVVIGRLSTISSRGAALLALT